MWVFYSVYFPRIPGWFPDVWAPGLSDYDCKSLIIRLLERPIAAWQQTLSVHLKAEITWINVPVTAVSWDVVCRVFSEVVAPAAAP